jgi:hypothetical protein
LNRIVSYCRKIFTPKYSFWREWKDFEVSDTPGRRANLRFSNQSLMGKRLILRLCRNAAAVKVNSFVSLAADIRHKESPAFSLRGYDAPDRLPQFS